MTGIDRIGATAPEMISAGSGADNVPKSPTASDFAAMIRKLAGPEMLWEEQTPEQVQRDAAGDDTDARGVLASGRRLQR